ncbi:hypothetical protein SS50377_27968 [Spironucleus salmonicida]|uniref:Uncharacterized protein n=1 Tax=Spironucleus salmonicida TaxID=348837 RepID=V6LDD7_9EUKA|nr:hypothetical protein SS50377_27968 [Spironucleus salmonicida]|eukprot:EST42525.1 Hypothetical protein SS50377_17838 [Spironucleus salmonicida]
MKSSPLARSVELQAPALPALSPQRFRSPHRVMQQQRMIQTAQSFSLQALPALQPRRALPNASQEQVRAPTRQPEDAFHLDLFTQRYLFAEPESKLERIKDLRAFGDMTREFFSLDGPFFVRFIVTNFARFRPDVRVGPTASLAMEKDLLSKSVLKPARNICIDIAAGTLEAKMAQLKQQQKSALRKMDLRRERQRRERETEISETKVSFDCADDEAER